MKSFDEIPLSEPLKRAVQDLGFTTPSPIQVQTLPILLGEPTDFLGLAATGTGKTAAFGLPMLERIDPDKKGIQAIVLCPTRELCLQVSEQIKGFAKYKKVKTLAVYGGAGFADQLHGLRSGVSIVVGTPGRVIDHIERGTLKLDSVSTVVLDEADEMISMGFRESIETILEEAPRDESNIWLFSATMSKEVRKVADEYLRNPKQVQVNRTEMVPSTIEQIYYMTQESHKPDLLCKLIDSAEAFYGIIFCQTKLLVSDVTQLLTSKGYQVDCLHGDKDQNARERTMNAFRKKHVSILVCTDVASRGLDVKDITHVINYSIPRELDNYVHRIGRTARSGKTGFAMSLVTPSHKRLIGQIEQLTKSKMKEGKLPTFKEVGQKKVSALFTTFQDEKKAAQATEMLDDNWKAAIEGMTPTEVAGRFIAMHFSDLFQSANKEIVMQSRKGADQRSRDGGARFNDRGPRRDGGGGRSFDRDRGPRRERSFDGPPRDRGFDRGPRREGGFDRGSRPERSFDGPRRERSFDGPPRDRAPRPERSFGGPRRDRDEFAPRANDRSASKPKRFAAQPPRDSGWRP